MPYPDTLDTELIAPLDFFLNLMGGGLNLRDIPATRAQSDEIFAGLLAQTPPVAGVNSEDLFIPSSDDSPPVKVRLYRPANLVNAIPALLWLHGGGYVLGNLDQDDLFLRQLSQDLQCAILAVDYRLAPEHPYPAPLEDCYCALAFLFDNAACMLIDSARIAIGGASAGGGLAAGLALLARDRGKYKPVFQVLLYPMLDDTNVQAASEEVPDTLLWGRENNAIGWAAYLGAAAGSSPVPAYAAPFRATELGNLPPAYIPVGSLDLFLQEDLSYATRLQEAGVTVELHVYPGCYHAFDTFAPMAQVSCDFGLELRKVLGRAFAAS